MSRPASETENFVNESKPRGPARKLAVLAVSVAKLDIGLPKMVKRENWSGPPLHGWPVSKMN